MSTNNATSVLRTEKTLLLKEEVAEILRCSPRTVERHRKEWGLRELHLNDGSTEGSDVRFLAADVERFILARIEVEQAQVSGQS